MLSTLHRSRDLHDFWAGIVAGARGELASCSDRRAPIQIRPAARMLLRPDAAPDHLGPGSRSSVRTAAHRCLADLIMGRTNEGVAEVPARDVL